MGEKEKKLNETCTTSEALSKASLLLCNKDNEKIKKNAKDLTNKNKSAVLIKDLQSLLDIKNKKLIENVSLIKNTKTKIKSFESEVKNQKNLLKSLEKDISSCKSENKL